MTIRYVGNEDFARRYLIQRRDGKLYTGRGWADRLDKARLYDDLSTVESAYRSLQCRRSRGQPKRAFRVQLNVTVHGSGRFSADDLRRFLAQALHLNFDNSAFGDGPNGTVVQAALAGWTLKEVDRDEPRRATPDPDAPDSVPDRAEGE